MIMFSVPWGALRRLTVFIHLKTGITLNIRAVSCPFLKRKAAKDSLLENCGSRTEQPSVRSRLRLYDRLTTRQRPADRSHVQVPQRDQHVSTFVHNSDIELPGPCVIPHLRVRIFRIRITRLRQRVDHLTSSSANGTWGIVESPPPARAAIVCKAPSIILG